MGLRVRARRLPHVGDRYEVGLRGDRDLVVVVQDDGRCQMSILVKSADEPEAVVLLERDQAVAVAALLTGARFSIDTTTDDPAHADAVTVETITLQPGSPAVGQVADELAFSAESDAAILAVIRGELGEVVDDEPTDPLRPGDKVVVSVRRDQATEIVRHLGG